MAGFGRIILVGMTVAAGLCTVALRAQTALEDPKNAPKIFANTCSACHKSPQGLAKGGNTASFLRQHYTTGPEMSAAMASYLAAAGSAPASRKNDKDKQKEASAPNSKAPTKRDQVSATHPLTDGATDHRPGPRDKDKKGTKATEPAKQAPVRQSEPVPIPVERATQPSAATAALSTPAAPASPAAEPSTPPPVVLDIPMPDLPTGPPVDLIQPPAFSSAPLP